MAAELVRVAICDAAVVSPRIDTLLPRAREISLKNFPCKCPNADYPTVHSVLDEILSRDRGPSIVVPTMVRKLYLDARNDHVARPRESAIGWRLKKFGPAGGELPVNAIAVPQRWSGRARGHRACRKK
jgi:hypothetical protein